MAETELIKCPMLKQNIDVSYCIELQMIANKEIKPTDNERYIKDEEWDICRNCKKQEYPIPDIVNT